MTILEDLLVRRLDVSTRRGEDGGLLLETLIGRYLLNVDGREVWQRFDGRRTVREVADAVAAARGLEPGAVQDGVVEVCERLLDLRLLERV